MSKNIEIVIDRMLGESSEQVRAFGVAVRMAMVADSAPCPGVVLDEAPGAACGVQPAAPTEPERYDDGSGYYGYGAPPATSGYDLSAEALGAAPGFTSTAPPLGWGQQAAQGDRPRRARHINTDSLSDEGTAECAARLRGEIGRLKSELSMALNELKQSNDSRARLKAENESIELGRQCARDQNHRYSGIVTDLREQLDLQRMATKACRDEAQRLNDGLSQAGALLKDKDAIIQAQADQLIRAGQESGMWQQRARHFEELAGKAKADRADNEAARAKTIAGMQTRLDSQGNSIKRQANTIREQRERMDVLERHACKLMTDASALRDLTERQARAIAEKLNAPHIMIAESMARLMGAATTARQANPPPAAGRQD